MDLLDLLRAATVNGAGSAVKLPQVGGIARSAYTVFVSGVFGGATVTLQASPDGVIWVDLPSAAYTAATIANIDLAAEAIRAVVSSASGTTSVTVLLRY